MSAARRFVLALDQGTTGSTALVVDPDGAVCARGYAELPQHFPRPGWVEHDPVRIWSTVEEAAGQALRAAGINGTEVAAIGIAINERRRWCGSAPPAGPSTTPSSGNAGVPRRCATA